MSLSIKDEVRATRHWSNLIEGYCGWDLSTDNPVYCPNCEHNIPAFDAPADFNENAIWSNIDCPSCQAEIGISIFHDGDIELEVRT